ncbi:RNase adapter RapZ [Shimia sp. Alg240-R146]|uniref:RNase adapter RapZ n=1 Tax=Shimia sp. Alg240-R146 TaxID=2993449 RepID=UPI0022E5E7A9|nr:RNase adapter RapZ [Shimia sp. Alg240-R146]
MTAAPSTSKKHRLLLLTGPSGAGRSTAINALEDSGYETIDNLPIGLLGRLLSDQPLTGPLALGLDVRNRDFSSQALLEALDLLKGVHEADPELLYLDCRADVLARRYSETRRRHPMAPDGEPSQGIRRELELFAPVRARADVLIDTSELSPHELRAAVEQHYAPKDGQSLALTVTSFSYKRGLPQSADMVFDCRFLRNPHWEPDLRPMDGGDAPVGAYVADDPSFDPFFDSLTKMLTTLLPAYIGEGRSHLMIAFGCTGGRHRSVFMADSVAAALAQQGWRVSIRHRELNRVATLPGHGPDSTADGEDKA